jgi:hypothetical protein
VQITVRITYKKMKLSKHLFVAQFMGQGPFCPRTPRSRDNRVLSFLFFKVWRGIEYKVAFCEASFALGRPLLFSRVFENCYSRKF